MTDGPVHRPCLDPAAPITAGHQPDIPVTLTASGTVAPPASDALYSPRVEIRGEPIAFTAVPYFLWGNREPGPMRVWIPVAAAG